MQQQREKHESQLDSRSTFLALRSSSFRATQREMRLSFRVQSQSQSGNWDVAAVGAGQLLLQTRTRTSNTGSQRAGKRREVKALPAGLAQPQAQWLWCHGNG